MIDAATTGPVEHHRLIGINRSCLCLPLDRDTIDAGIARRSRVTSLADLLAERQNLFAGTAVFVSDSDISAMLSQIASIEAICALNAYRGAALARTDRRLGEAQPGTHGVLMGFDFHISPDGPRLIEINTNAGGAFLVNMLETAAAGDLLACGGYGPSSTAGFEASILDMFVSEWRRAGRTERPGSIAIVDDNPAGQFLYPELLLAQELFNRNGIRTVVATPEALEYKAGGLMFEGQNIDMVYNRLTDFSLSDPANQPLRSALLEDKAVVSPAPRHHALFADKRNLITLSNQDRLRALGVSPPLAAALRTIPQTLSVTKETAETLWARRREFFFKPSGGFGSRGAYRGSKLTRRVWSDIVAGDYIAQQYIAPTTRGLIRAGSPAELKFDVRIFTYAGSPLAIVARVYQGQTTNFRTDGGGFAPVVRPSGGPVKALTVPQFY